MLPTGFVFLVFLSASAWRHLWVVVAVSALGLIVEFVWVTSPAVLEIGETRVCERTLLLRPLVFEIADCGVFTRANRSFLGPPKIVFEYPFPTSWERGWRGVVRRVWRQTGPVQAASFRFRYEDTESDLVEVLNAGQRRAAASSDGE
jgi:hypothetical protein